ncbi:MAG: hypothetical protein ACPH64_09285, partial [Porticoccaceae bacterium]
TLYSTGAPNPELHPRPAQQNSIEQQLLAGQLDLLYIAPERLIQSYTLDLLSRIVLNSSCWQGSWIYSI